MSGKVQTILVSVFASEDDAAAQVEFADNSKDQQVPVSFFNLRGSKVASQDAYTLSFAFKGFSMIVAESARALEMRGRAQELYNLQDKEAVPQTQWIPNWKKFCFSSSHRDYNKVSPRHGNITRHWDRGHRHTKHAVAAQLEPNYGATSRNDTSYSRWLQIVVSSRHPRLRRVHDNVHY